MDCLFLWILLEKQKNQPKNIPPITNDAFPFGDKCCDPLWNPIDQVYEHNCNHNDNDHTVYQRDTVTGTNVSLYAYNILPRKNDSEIPSLFPSDVLFNLTSSRLTRYKRHIEGIRAQQYFIQRLSSTITGTSIHLLYLMAVCFPSHFICNPHIIC